jgi:hypothetical protein
MNKIVVLLSLLLPMATVVAQEQTSSIAPEAVEEKTPVTTAEKKMVREANINLQTTVTGNQEQPRVMYILPWQSPLSPELEMEMLSSQEDAVFGHVEREELTRALEAADEVQ